MINEDYKRAAGFLYRQNLNNKKVFNPNVITFWSADSSGFSFITRDKKEILFNKLEYGNMGIAPLFDQSRLLKLLSDSLKKTVGAADLVNANMRFIDKTHVSFTAFGKIVVVNLANYSLSVKNDLPQNLMEQKSPDGEWVEYSENSNLFIKSVKNGTVKQLSTS